MVSFGRRRFTSRICSGRSRPADRGAPCRRRRRSPPARSTRGSCSSRASPARPSKPTTASIRGTSRSATRSWARSTGSISGRRTRSSPSCASLKVDLTFAIGGIKNHELYFAHLGGEGGDPDGAFRTLVERDFGSVDAWRADLRATAIAARGWAWTAYDWDERRLFNYLGDAQNTFPVWNATPLVALDVYEHAYFLDYQTDRGAYVDAFFENLDWSVVNGWIASYAIPF